MNQLSPALFLGLALGLAGCATNINNQIAIYRVIDGHFEITLSGQRRNMPHNPVAYFFGSTPVQLVLSVPRIQGKVDGQEIPVPKGDYKYVGKVEFTDSIMNIDLRYDAYDRNTQYPVSWNGKYKLVPSNE